MPRAEFFEQCGLFVIPAFFDVALCAHLRATMLAARGVASAVTRPDGTRALDEETRRSAQASVAGPALALVEGRLAALRPQLEWHFQVALERHQPPQFLVYPARGAFQPHRDRGAAPGLGTQAEERKVSVVIFLNGQTQGDDGPGFGGGYLTFYGITEPRDFPLPLIAEPGLLIAFPSDVIHAVTPVTHGERCTVVTWFV